MTRIARNATQTRTQTGLAAGARVMTLDGPIPVEFLEPGDRIVTRRGIRSLRAIRVVERAEAEMVAIPASALGHGRPQHDIVVAAAQPMILRDWRALTLYGEMQALLPAARLCDGKHVTAKRLVELRTFSLSFDVPEVVFAEGVELMMEDTPETC